MVTTTELTKSKVLVTILYKTPDCPSIIQEFNYEGYDIPPEFPYFDMFMEYWKKNIPSIILDIKGLCDPELNDKYVYLQEDFIIH